MYEKNKLVEYLEKGYLINGPILKISTIQDKENFLEVFPIDNGIDVLKNPLNQEKNLIMLRNGNNTTEIITNHKGTIELAVQKQKEPFIITEIHAVCEILGTDIAEVGTFDFENFVHALNENSNWEFILGDHSDSIFTVKVRIESLDPQLIDEFTEKIQKFIDLLAISQNVGILIHDITNCKTKKEPEPILVVIGKPKRRLGKPSKKLISKIAYYSTSYDKNELHIAAHGLNLSYIENCLPNRVSMLWATVETLFKTKPEHLLNKEEMKILIKGIDQLDLLKSEDDKWRLKKLKEGIKNPNLFSLKNRNERIALFISNELDLDYNETLKNIKLATSIRGKHLHELRDEWSEIRNTEKYLQGILRAYIYKKLSNVSPS
jgi:hypothetical protein